MTLAPGVHADYPSSLYHIDDFGDQPSLSASIAKLLCNESPLHAWTRHPKLNAEYVHEDDRKYDAGRVIHGVFLEGQAGVHIIDADNYRTKAAQEERDAAYAQGKTPLLKHEWPTVNAAAVAVRKQLLKHKADPPLFRDGKAEVTLVWEEPGGVVCRSRLDWLRDDRLAVDDLKCTTRSANPESWSRTIFDLNYDLQAAFYLRGVEVLTGRQAEFRLCVVEVNPPHAVSVIGIGGEVLALGRKKFQFALDRWRKCLASGEWPAYPLEVCWAELPGYVEERWLSKEVREEMAA